MLNWFQTLLAGRDPDEPWDDRLNLLEWILVESNSGRASRLIFEIIEMAIQRKLEEGDDEVWEWWSADGRKSKSRAATKSQGATRGKGAQVPKPRKLPLIFGERPQDMLDLDIGHLPGEFAPDRGHERVRAPKIKDAVVPALASEIMRAIAASSVDPEWSRIFEQLADRLAFLEGRHEYAKGMDAIKQQLEGMAPRLEAAIAAHERLEKDYERAQRDLRITREGARLAAESKDQAIRDAEDARAALDTERARHREFRREAEEELRLREEDLVWAEDFDAIRTQREEQLFEEAHTKLGHAGSLPLCSDSWCREAHRLVKEGVTVPKREPAKKTKKAPKLGGVVPKPSSRQALEENAAIVRAASPRGISAEDWREQLERGDIRVSEWRDGPWWEKFDD